MILRPAVLLLTNIPTPYRLPVFEAIGERVDLTVYFCEGHDPDRLWRVSPSSKQARYETGTVRRLPAGIIWNPDLGSRLRRTPFDVYLAGDNFTNAPSVLTAWRAARRRHRPFIIWCEALDTAYASGNLVSNAYRHWLYPRTDAFLAYGQRAEAYLVTRNAAPDRIVRGRQVIPPELIPPPTLDKPALGLAGKTVVLCVGYFIARKGIDRLIRAFLQVAQADDVLVLAGGGPEEPSLRTMSQGDARILFPGYVEGPDKSNWYAAADLFVLPTFHDPWGLVVNEAMAFGLPVITTDAAGCVPDIVRHEDNGLVVPVGDEGELGAALATLLRNADLCRRMGQRSHALIADYTTEAARDRFLDVIARALDHHQP